MKQKYLHLCALLPALLLASCDRASSQDAPPKAPIQWELNKPIVFGVTQLDKPDSAPDTALQDAAKTGYLETPVTSNYGDLGGVSFPNSALPPGRYRATFEMGAPPYPQGDFFAQVDVRTPDTARPRQFKTRVTPIDFPAQGFIKKSVEFVVPTGEVLYVSAKPQWNGEPGMLKAETLRLKSVVITRLTAPLFIAQTRPTKVLLKPGEAGTMDVTLVNTLDTEQKIALALSEEFWLDQTNKLATKDVTVGAGQTVTAQIPFKAWP